MMTRYLPALLALAPLAFPPLLPAQNPVIGIIDFYGLGKVSEEKVRKALGVHEGDKLPSKADAEERLENLPGVVRAQLSASCCDNGKAILYVGIEERGARHFDMRSDPTGDERLPEDIHAAYALFLGAVSKAAQRGDVSEDLTQGHSLMADPECRRLQERFIELAGQHPAILRKVLRESADEEQRAMAAYVIGYASKKKLVTEDLQYAMQDPDPTVRSNAMRALGAILVLASRDPEQEIKVSPTWFIESLNSIYWTDRNNAAVALVNFTENRDPNVLAQVKERSLHALTEMARWKHLPHSLPAFILLGRIAQVPEPQIQDMWKKGEREKLLAMVRTGTAKK